MIYLERFEQPFERQYEPQYPEARPIVHQRRKAALDREGNGWSYKDSAHVRCALVHETHCVPLLSQAFKRPLQAGPPVQGLQVQRPPKVQGPYS